MSWMQGLTMSMLYTHKQKWLYWGGLSNQIVPFRHRFCVLRHTKTSCGLVMLSWNKPLMSRSTTWLCQLSVIATLPWFIRAIVASAGIFQEIFFFVCLYAPSWKSGLSALCTELWEAAFWDCGLSGLCTELWEMVHWDWGLSGLCTEFWVLLLTEENRRWRFDF